MTAPNRSLDVIAREHTERAVATLAEVMDDPFSDNKDRIKAASEILDRGHGKATQAVIQIPESQALRSQLAAMSDDDLLSAISDARLPRLLQSSPRTVDAQPIEIAPTAHVTALVRTEWRKKRAQEPGAPASADDFDDPLLA